MPCNEDPRAGLLLGSRSHALQVEIARRLAMCPRDLHGVAILPRPLLVRNTLHPRDYYLYRKLTRHTTSQRHHRPQRLPVSQAPVPVDRLLQGPPVRLEERQAHPVPRDLVPHHRRRLRRPWVCAKGLRERSPGRRRPLLGACVRVSASERAAGWFPGSLRRRARGRAALLRDPRPACEVVCADGGWAGWMAVQIGEVLVVDVVRFRITHLLMARGSPVRRSLAPRPVVRLS
jgi:hypothetical protein